MCVSSVWVGKPLFILYVFHSKQWSTEGYFGYKSHSELFSCAFFFCFPNSKIRRLFYFWRFPRSYLRKNSFFFFCENICQLSKCFVKKGKWLKQEGALCEPNKHVLNDRSWAHFLVFSLGFSDQLIIAFIRFTCNLNMDDVIC